MDKASELLFRTAEPFAMACVVVCELELENERLRTLATEALELTKYGAAAFAYTEAGSGTPEWFEGLREQLETLQPKLMDVVTPNDKHMMQREGVVLLRQAREEEIENLRALLADIKAWDVEQYMSIPHKLRARIEAALTPNLKKRVST